MPSYYESLSMVALEAWAVGTPVIANAQCDVLLGQCLRSNAGLYYADAAEFGAVLDRDRERPRAGGTPRPERPRVLRAALQLAGDRTEISRYVRIAFVESAAAPDGKRCQDGWPGGNVRFAPRRRSLTNCRRDRSSILIADLKDPRRSGGERSHEACVHHAAIRRRDRSRRRARLPAARGAVESAPRRRSADDLRARSADVEKRIRRRRRPRPRRTGAPLRRQPAARRRLRSGSSPIAFLRRRAPAPKKWTGSAGSGRRRQG